METSERHVELKVGLFALAAVAALVALVVALSHVRLRDNGPELAVDFAGVAGLEVRAPVRLGGVEVGQVAAIGLLAEDAQPPPAARTGDLGRQATPRVRVRVQLDPAAARFVTPDMRLALATQGLIGETFLELIPGAAPTTGGAEAALTAPAAALRGVDAPRLQAMALQLEAMLEAVGGLLGSGPTPPSELGRSLAELIGHVNAVLTGRRERIGAAIDDAAAALADARAAVAALRAGVADGRDLHGLLADGARSVHALDARLPALLTRGQASLDALASLAVKVDRQVDGTALAHILAQGDAATVSLAELSGDAQKIVRDLRGGRGSAGAFLVDSQIYDDVKELFRDLKHHPWKFFWRD